MQHAPVLIYGRDFENASALAPSVAAAKRRCRAGPPLGERNPAPPGWPAPHFMVCVCVGVRALPYALSCRICAVRNCRSPLGGRAGTASHPAAAAASIQPRSARPRHSMASQSAPPRTPSAPRNTNEAVNFTCPPNRRVSCPRLIQRLLREAKKYAKETLSFCCCRAARFALSSNVGESARCVPGG